MSCIYKIRQAMPSLTANDRKIAAYILDHPREVIYQSAQELSAAVNTSAAAWVRFAKHIGYDGLTALKMDLASSGPERESDDLYNTVINEQDSIPVLIQKVRRISEKALADTYALLSSDRLQQAVDTLIRAETVYLIGIGGSGIVCMDLMHKLTRINKRVVWHEDIHVLMAEIAHIRESDVLVAISYSGRTGIVNEAVRYARGRHVPTIAVTQYSMKTPLAKTADICLFQPVDEKDLRLGAVSSRNAALALTDLLYYGVAKENLDKTKEALICTRELIRKIR